MDTKKFARFLARCVPALFIGASIWCLAESTSSHYPRDQEFAVTGLFLTFAGVIAALVCSQMKGTS